MAFVLIALTLGPMLAAVAVMAIWLTLGSSKLMWRTIFAILGASGLGLLFCASSGELEAEWLGLMWIVVVTVAGMFVLVRWQGLRLVNTAKPNLICSNEFQFSVSQLLALTAAVALVVAFARVLAPMIATVNALLIGLGIAICLGALAVVASLTTLRLQEPKAGLRLFAIATIMTTGLVFVVMEATNADPGIVWGSVVVVYALCLRASFRFARTHGFSILSTSELASLRTETEQ